MQHALKLLALLAVLACSAGSSVDSDALISGLVPRRGPVDSDAAVTADVTPDVTAATDAAPADVTADVIDAAAPIERPDMRSADAGRCPELPTGSYGTTECLPRTEPRCFAASIDGGPLGTCWRYLPGETLPYALYVPSCPACPGGAL